MTVTIKIEAEDVNSNNPHTTERISAFLQRFLLVNCDLEIKSMDVQRSYIAAKHGEGVKMTAASKRGGRS